MLCHAYQSHSYSKNSFMVPVRILSAFLSFCFPLALLCFGLHICLAFWVRQEIICYTFWMAWIHTYIHVYLCVCSLIVLTALVACAWLALWHSLLVALHLSLHSASEKFMHALTLTKGWSVLYAHKMYRNNIPICQTSKIRRKVFGWSKFPAARGTARYLITNKHRNKLHISNGRWVAQCCPTVNILQFATRIYYKHMAARRCRGGGAEAQPEAKAKTHTKKCFDK